MRFQRPRPPSSLVGAVVLAAWTHSANLLQCKHFRQVRRPHVARSGLQFSPGYEMLGRPTDYGPVRLISGPHPPGSVF